MEKKDNKTVLGNIAKTVVFVLVFMLLLGVVMEPLKLGDYSIAYRDRGMKKEKTGTLDAVYIGASHEFSFFEPPLAWEDHGISVFSYSFPSMPACAISYRLIEARKHHPDALYIININTFKTEKISTQSMHRSLDYMDWSLNKVQMLLRMAKEGDLALSSLPEYFFPFIRFHSRWTKLDSVDYNHPVNGLKGAYTYNPFFTTVLDMSDQVVLTDEKTELTQGQQDALNDLLTYLENNEVRVLFVTVPQFLSEEAQGQLNTIEDILTGKGYDVLDLAGRWDEMGIQLDTDIHDKSHVNIHGAIKYTDYLSRYLIEHYGFTDKRGQPGYESWDESVVSYHGYIDRHVLDFEIRKDARDYEMAIPAGQSAKVKGSKVILNWEACEKAESYLIYRKTSISGARDWKLIGETAELTYTDEPQESATYTYTIVPVRQDGSQTICGKFDSVGQAVSFSKEGN